MDRPQQRASVVDAALLEAWLRCERRAWLQYHAPDLAAPADGLATLLSVQRADLSRLLRSRHAGVASAPDGTSPAAAPAPPTFGARFETPLQALTRYPRQPGQVVLARASIDLLERGPEPDGWTAAALATGTRVREHHVRRLALAGMVAGTHGVQAGRAWVIHLDRGASRDQGVPRLRTVDVSDRYREQRARLPGRLEALMASLRPSREPETRVGPHCLRPRRCPFADLCWEGVGRHSIYAVWGLGIGTRRAWRAAGWLRVDDVPRDAPGASPAEGAALDDARAGRVRIDRSGLRQALARLAYPVAYLDIEFATPAIPLVPGTAPFDPLPFQFSLHLERRDGSVEHRDELRADVDEDPRPPLAARLARALDGAGSVVVYDAASEGRLLEVLAGAAPGDAERLRGAARRLWDLLEVVRSTVRHPGFAARWDLKSVASTLAPGTYGDLALDNGAGAQALWRRSLKTRTSEVERTLRAYCASDSGAMLGIVRALRRHADDGGAAALAPPLP